MVLSARDYLAGSPAPLHGYTLGRLFDTAVNEGADRPAIMGEGWSLSWEQWAGEAAALGRGLQEIGVGPGHVAAVQLPNSRDFLTVHMALALIGAVILPLHPAIGPADAAALIERGGAELLLCAPDAPHRRLRESCPGLRHIVLAGPEDETGIGVEGGHPSVAGLLARWSDHAPHPVRVLPDDPFVLVASSGTTSNRPKICVHSHHGLLANAAAAAAAGETGRNDVLVCASPFAHLFGLFAIHLGLVTGAAQAVLPGWDADRLLRVAAESRATTLLAVPAQLEDLAGRLDRLDPGRRPRLREIRTGGAAVPARLVTRLTGLTGAGVVVQWGMSELGATLYTHPTDPPELAARSIGRPAPGVEARVVGADGEDLGDGSTGELRIHSPFVFRGYLGEPALTAAALPTDGWLRTGDLAARLPDGTFAFRGRSTDVINVGGQKVNALELEQLLADLPGLGPIAVVGRPDERLGEYPCLVVTADADPPGLDEVLRHLADKGISEYKWPVEMVRIERLPLTPTGKIARGRLIEAVQSAGPPPAAAATAQDLANSPDGRRGTLERVLEHTRLILGGGQPVSAGLAFQEAGLSSLGAVRLARALGAAFGRELASTVVFDYPTPAALAEYLSGPGGKSWATAPASLPAAERIDVESDPVAIVGMACRLPGGVDTPRALWSLLVDGGDVIGALPADRGWPLDRLYTPQDEWDGLTRCLGGGFLADPGGFDAGFFGITPEEAEAMDPQQRVVLEVAWEALENAGIPLDELRGTDTGVFLGMMASDYAPRILERPERYRGQSIIGNSAAVASGRIAYFLGIHGPAVTVDTACSSSLVALHQARRAIQLGECARALVGGVTVMSTPASLVEFGRQGALSADGRCKAFGADADGAGWAEGAGTLVLEPLSTARQAGHRVLAVLRGGAVNQDGASNGLTAPNGLAQQAVIAAALADAGLQPADVSAVEAHGTGTALGDPIEIRAIQAVYGADRAAGAARPEEPVWLGSVKSNLGHTQAAAGIVGVIKMVLAFQHDLLPRTLHADPPTPHVDWSAGTVRVLTQPVAWPRGPRPRRAGISSFGIGGTNAHIILEEPPPESEADEPRADRPRPWVLSARSPRDLQETARRLTAVLQEQPRLRAATARDTIGHVLARRRTSFPYRAAVLPDADGDFTAGLEDAARGHPTETTHLATGHVARDAVRTVFVFPGHGSQWPAMGRELMRDAPAFAQAMAACDQALRPHTGWSVRDLVSGDASGAGSAPDGPDVSQPALFAMMVSLAALWESYGVRPDAVLGHSQGEIAAAYVAGALSLQDAAAVVAVRGRLLGRLVGRGTMAAARMSADEARRRVEPWRGRLAVAAFNGPRAVVISGDEEAMAGFRDAAAQDGVDVRPLRIDFASHCEQVDPVLPRIEAELGGITPRKTSVPFFSTVEGGWLDGDLLTPGYWCRNLRRPVGFHHATRELAAAGFDVFLEASPHPVLTHALEQSSDELGGGLIVLDTLRRDEGGLPRFLHALGEAYCRGANVDRTVLYPGPRTPAVDLPTYPFRRRRYWQDGTPVSASSPPSTRSGPPEPRETVVATEDLRRRLAGLSSAQAEERLLDLVRERAAATAGFDDASEIAPDRTFISMGFSSLASTRIAAALSSATGVRVPPDVLLDQPTPRAVGRHLARLLERPEPRRSPETETSAAALAHLGGLVSAACAAGNGHAALEILKAAAALRAGDSGEPAEPARPVTLSRGEREPVLLLFPSLTTLGGPAQYAALASPLAGIRDVHVLPQPGFAEHEPIPRDLESAVALQTLAVRACAGDRPFILCGHSSGGWMAHAVAQRCAADGLPAAGTILLDSFWPDEQLYHSVLPRIIGRLAEPDRAVDLGTAGLARLSAVGAYLRFFGAWTPQETTSPTLFIRAGIPLGADLPPAQWLLPHKPATVDAGHFEMVDTQSTAIVEAIEDWIGGHPPVPARAVEARRDTDPTAQAIP
jgi:acyl transferase domain-containing protein/acyl-CoA synthetase (AMP-forming)/AMP-acid ligase II